MSIIAWDGKTLAADRMATSVGYAATTDKIFRLDANRLVGIAGDLSVGLAVVEWLRRNEPPEAFPKRENDEFASVLVVYRNGPVVRYENRGVGFVVYDAFTASGSGRDFALMAMHLGKTAEEAVRLTCELSTECGMGVSTLRFDE